MEMKTFAAAASPPGSPTLTKPLALQSPITVLEKATATLIASSSSGKSMVTIPNPMQQAVQGLRVACSGHVCGASRLGLS